MYAAFLRIEHGMFAVRTTFFLLFARYRGPQALISNFLRIRLNCDLRFREA